jgi:hypothetical protein
MLSPCHHDFAAHFTAPAAEEKPATAPKVHLREGQKRFGHLPLRVAGGTKRLTTAMEAMSVAMEKTGGFECIPNI